MRDRKKFCIPKIARYPKAGDVVVWLKGGKYQTVPYKEFKKVSSFFKIKSFKGESSEIPGSLKMSSKDFTGNGTFSPSDYASLEDKFTIEEIIGNKQNPQDGDILVYNSYIDQSAVFSFDDWVNSDDSWEITGLQGITTYEEEDAEDGDYIILANGHTLIIKPADYSKVSSNWEHVETITIPQTDTDQNNP